MELYQEIMQKYKEECFSRFPEIDAALVHDRCYQALHKIREILADPPLSDSDCFAHIEAIVCTLEELGSFAVRAMTSDPYPSRPVMSSTLNPGCSASVTP